MDSHLHNLDALLQRLEDYGLRVRQGKCEFFQSSVEYLGHVIDATSLYTAPSKYYNSCGRTPTTKCEPAEVFFRPADKLWALYTHSGISAEPTT